MKIYLLNSIYFISYYIGVVRLFYFLNNKRQRVITYHNIIPDKYFSKSLCLGVSCKESNFNYQIRLIEDVFNITTQLNKPGTCMITFDDGYQNNYSIAMNILDKYKVKAIFFISFDLVDKKKIIWIDNILKWCSFIPNGLYTLKDLTLQVKSDNRLFIYQQIINIIRKEYKLRDDIIKLLNQQYPFCNLNVDAEFNLLRFCPLNFSQITEMKKNNHLIASHTISHDILSLLTKQELRSEINTSESLIGKFYNCDYFAYPFGQEIDIPEISTNKFRALFVNYWNYFSEFSLQRIERFSLPDTKNKYIIHAHLSGLYYFLRYFLKYV